MLVIVNKLHCKKVVCRCGRPLTDHLLTTYRPLTNHLPTTYQPLTNHLTTTYQPPTDHLLTTYWPSTDHLPTIYRQLFLRCSLFTITDYVITWCKSWVRTQLYNFKGMWVNIICSYFVQNILRSYWHNFYFRLKGLCHILGELLTSIRLM